MKTKHYFFLAIAAVLVISAIILKIGQISSLNENKDTLNSSVLDSQLSQVYDKMDEAKIDEADIESQSWNKNEEVLTVEEELELNSGFDPVIFISPNYNEVIISPLEINALLSKDWFRGDGIYIELINSNNVVLSAKYIDKSNFINDPKSEYYSFISKIEFEHVLGSGKLQLRQEYAKDKYSSLAIPIFFNQE